MPLIRRILGQKVSTILESLTPHIMILLDELRDQSFIIKIRVATSPHHYRRLRIPFLVGEVS
jgi:hypothetical protein